MKEKTVQIVQSTLKAEPTLFELKAALEMQFTMPKLRVLEKKAAEIIQK
jgi:hypothetical protein